MRVLIVNTSEKIGGAAIAANRLMQALKNNGVKARMLVRDKQTNQLSVCAIPSSWLLPLKFVWERGIIWLANGLRRRNVFQVDIANTGTDITRMFEFQQADIIHLHWVNQGFLSLTDLQKILDSGKPVVLTMHDMWYFTGICHYSGTCQKYESQCQKCEILTGGGFGRDWAQYVFNQKREIFSRKKLAFVGCSRWITELARKSRLTEGHLVANIPNAIDTNLFHPIDRQKAREAHHLPTDRKLILFGSQRITDARKGFKYLAQACEIIVRQHPDLARQLGVVVLGGKANEVRDRLPLDIYPVEYISNVQAIMEIYNAVDLYVTPSLQDNLPNTIVEALACGTPCVGFNVGGIPEMIDHKENGYVANYQDATDFANGIAWCLDEGRYEQLATAAHDKAIEAYSQASVASQYMKIYETMMAEE